MHELLKLGSSELVKLIQTGEYSCRDAARAALDQLDEMQYLNSLINIDVDAVMSQARHLDSLLHSGKVLPLHGLPIVIKDNIDTKDFPTTAGTPALAKNQPQENAPAVQRLVDAGVLIIGKSNLDELAGGVTNNNAFFGPARNPYNSELSPGGSSGGTAAAVSSRIVSAGLGTDTGGSSRIPASLCGICGFRPSVGRYPSDGVIGMPRSRATVGLFAGSVNDIALLDEIISRDTEHNSADLSNLRVGVPRIPFFEGLDPATGSIIEEAIEHLCVAGITIIEKNFPKAFELNDKVSFPIALYEARADLEKYVSRLRPPISLESLIAEITTPGIKELMSTVLHDVSKANKDYQHAVKELRPELFRAYDRYFDDDKLDIMIYPTTLLPARPIGQDKNIELNGEQHATFHAYARNSDPGANARIPSLSLPAGLTNDGLPVGLSIDGKRGTDRKVLSISATIQGLIPSIPPPPL